VEKPGFWDTSFGRRMRSEHTVLRPGECFLGQKTDKNAPIDT